MSPRQQRVLQTILEHLEEPMAKNKAETYHGDEVVPTPEAVAPVPPETNPWINGALAGGQTEATPKKQRRQLSTPLQAMARIEQEMNRLLDAQRRIVVAWFRETYDPPRVPTCNQPPLS